MKFIIFLLFVVITYSDIWSSVQYENVLRTGEHNFNLNIFSLEFTHPEMNFYLISGYGYTPTTGWFIHSDKKIIFDCGNNMCAGSPNYNPCFSEEYFISCVMTCQASRQINMRIDIIGDSKNPTYYNVTIYYKIPF